MSASPSRLAIADALSPAIGPSLLRFEGIGMRFAGGTEALAGIGFSVARGEFVSVVGPSGCGKSTLLRIAAGLMRATSGTVAVDSPRIGCVFQQAALLPWRRLAGNVGLLAELEGIATADRQRLTREAIDLVGLTGFERHFPAQLSGGMQMRASLARALTLSPEIFLMDEPFGALDELTRERLNEEVMRLFHARRFAGLLITHAIGEAIYMSSRVLVMSPRPGRIVAEFAVPYAYPRPPELKFDAGFTRLSREVSRALKASGSA
jgi:NitT/TauT family transport system ATP-binding protein